MLIREDCGLRCWHLSMGYGVVELEAEILRRYIVGRFCGGLERE